LHQLKLTKMSKLTKQQKQPVKRLRKGGKGRKGRKGRKGVLPLKPESIPPTGLKHRIVKAWKKVRAKASHLINYVGFHSCIVFDGPCAKCIQDSIAKAELERQMREAKAKMLVDQAADLEANKARIVASLKKEKEDKALQVEQSRLYRIQKDIEDAKNQEEGKYHIWLHNSDDSIKHEYFSYFSFEEKRTIYFTFTNDRCTEEIDGSSVNPFNTGRYFGLVYFGHSKTFINFLETDYDYLYSKDGERIWEKPENFYRLKWGDSM
jgi:hypothetical protein